MEYKILFNKPHLKLQSLKEVAEDIYEVFRAAESIAPEMFKGAYFLDSKKKDWQWQDEATKQLLVEELFNLKKGKIRYWYKIKNPTPDHKQVEGYQFSFFLNGDFGLITYGGGGNHGSGFYFDFRTPIPSELCFNILKRIVNIYKPLKGFIFEDNFVFSDLDRNDITNYQAAWISYFEESIRIPAFNFEVAYRKQELNGEFIKTIEGDFDSNNPTHVEKAMQMVNFFIEHKIFQK